MTTVPPKIAPYPVASYLDLDAKSSSVRLLHSCKKASEKNCEIDARIGIFFDGTNNNLQRDLEGVRIVSSEDPNRSHLQWLKITAARLDPTVFGHAAFKTGNSRWP